MSDLGWKWGRIPGDLEHDEKIRNRAGLFAEAFVLQLEKDEVPDYLPLELRPLEVILHLRYSDRMVSPTVGAFDARPAAWLEVRIQNPGGEKRWRGGGFFLELSEWIDGPALESLGRSAAGLFAKNLYRTIDSVIWSKDGDEG